MEAKGVGMFTFSQRSKDHMKGVDPRLIAIAERALTLTPVDFGVPDTGGLRTTEQQAELFIRGKSTLDGVNFKSNHQSGNALDVFAYVDGKASWDMNHLTTVAAAMLQAASELGIKLRWGGHWTSFVDAPHFELID